MSLRRWKEKVETILRDNYALNMLQLNSMLESMSEEFDLREVHRHMSPSEFVVDILGNPPEEPANLADEEFKDYMDDIDDMEHREYQQLRKEKALRKLEDPELILTLNEARDIFLHDGNYDLETAERLTETYFHLFERGLNHGESAATMIDRHNLLKKIPPIRTPAQAKASREKRNYLLDNTEDSEKRMLLEEAQEVFYHDGGFEWSDAYNIAKTYFKLILEGHQDGRTVRETIYDYRLIR